MRALILLICLSICSATILMAQTAVTGTGSFKSIENWEITFSLKDGKTSESSKILKQRITFRPNGNKDEETFYKPDGSIITRMVYTYDDAGHVTGHYEYAPTLDKTLSVPRRHIFTLDGFGRRIEYKVIEADGEITSRFTYRYDDSGKLIEEDIFPRTGNTSTRVLHTYDEKGRLTGDLTYDGDKLSSSFSIKYDSNGDCAETTRYVGGKLDSRTVYVSDDKHRPISEDTFVEEKAMGKPNKDGIMDLPLTDGPKSRKTITNYDDAARTKEVLVYDSTGVLTQRIVSGFDEHGQQTSSSTFDGTGKARDSAISFYDGNQLQGTLQGPSIIQREYNSRGMLTKTIYSILGSAGTDPQPYKIEEQVISYY